MKDSVHFPQGWRSLRHLQHNHNFDDLRKCDNTGQIQSDGSVADCVEFLEGETECREACTQSQHAQLRIGDLMSEAVPWTGEESEFRGNWLNTRMDYHPENDCSSAAK